MGIFDLVKSKDEEKDDYRTKRVTLELYDEFAESICTGKPYQIRLDPPADPRCCHLPKGAGTS